MALHITYDRYRLGNGLNVILHQDKRVPLVSVNLWYHVGSRNEKKGKTGYAHLFEHMMFQGSEHVPADKHFQYIQSIGGTLNGSTFFDRTNYFETVPSHHLETALWLEADRMGFFLPALTQEKLDTQLNVVKNERRQRYENQPYGLWLEHLLSMSFKEDFPYHWPVIGYMEDLDTANLQDVKDFFSTWYTPSNASLVVAGDFETRQTKSLIEKYFAGLSSSSKSDMPIEIFRDYNRGEQRRILHENVQLPRIYMAYHLPPFGQNDTYVADMICDILSSGKRGRLYKTLVYEQQIAQDAQAILLPMQGTSVLILMLTPQPGISLKKLKVELQNEIDNLSQKAVAALDIERIKNQIKARKLRELQSVSSRADYLNMFSVYFDDPDLINTEIEHYLQIEADDILRVAKSYLDSTNRSVVTYFPESEADEAV